MVVGGSWLVVEEQEEQVVKLRKDRGGVVGELVESKEETSNKVARFPATTTATRRLLNQQEATFF